MGRLPSHDACLALRARRALQGVPVPRGNGALDLLVSGFSKVREATLISSMETQTLSAREAVARVVEDWWGMGLGECRGGGMAWDWTCPNEL